MPVRYRSLVEGGFYSSNPFDRSVPVSIRCNNPGAINGAAWEKTYPGYVDTVETTPGNKTTIFEAPEYGVAVWWELLRRYSAAGVATVGGVINRYGGGQDYSAYIGSTFRSIRFGSTEDHARGNIIQYNFLRNSGGITFDEKTGYYGMDIVKFREGVRGLSELLLTIEGRGDYDGGKRLIQEQGRLDDKTEAGLKRLAGIPVDIEFKQ